MTGWTMVVKVPLTEPLSKAEFADILARVGKGIAVGLKRPPLNSSFRLEVVQHDEQVGR
jgi:hypothetical protein